MVGMFMRRSWALLAHGQDYHNSRSYRIRYNLRVGGRGGFCGGARPRQGVTWNFSSAGVNQKISSPGPALSCQNIQILDKVYKFFSKMGQMCARVILAWLRPTLSWHIPPTAVLGEKRHALVQTKEEVAHTISIGNMSLDANLGYVQFLTWQFYLEKQSGTWGLEVDPEKEMEDKCWDIWSR